MQKKPAEAAGPKERVAAVAGSGDNRMVRSIKDLQDIVYSLNQQGVTLRATEQPVDTRLARDGGTVSGDTQLRPYVRDPVELNKDIVALVAQ